MQFIANYTWVDGSIGTFRRWAPLEPSNPLDELCVEMDINYINTFPSSWYDYICTGINHYVCEGDQGTSIIIYCSMFPFLLVIKEINGTKFEVYTLIYFISSFVSDMTTALKCLSKQRKLNYEKSRSNVL